MKSSLGTFFSRFLTAAAVSLGITTSAQAGTEAIQPEDMEKKEKAMVMVTSDSLQTQGMAMVLSHAMQQKGTAVNILLCDRAGDLAVAEYESDAALAPKGMKPEGLLQTILDKGADVAVCALYLPNSDYQKSDLRKGVSTADPENMAEMMSAPNTRVFHF